MRLDRVAFLAVAALAISTAGAGKKTSLKIEPGPTTISPSEAAITADPAAGIEHAVILVEEGIRNEDLGTEMQTTYHMRAKILSNKGRDLANIELPAGSASMLPIFPAAERMLPQISLTRREKPVVGG